jgi:hypothetical protein
VHEWLIWQDDRFYTSLESSMIYVTSGKIIQ